MTTGRKLRLAVSTAILAVLFAFVTIGHTGVHATSAPADPPCAMCGPASDALVSLAPVSPVFDEPRLVESPTDAPLTLHVPIRQLSRGPPSRG